MSLIQRIFDNLSIACDFNIIKHKNLVIRFKQSGDKMDKM